ncbi:MAG: alpha/beta hydrolase [Leptospira sp.]|nr:alpha/beta hydrolase [Leptospira sp.]
MIILSQCRFGKTDIGESLNLRISDPYDKTKSVEIFFATNRKTNLGAQEACSNIFFTAIGDSKEKLGSCEINVPANHEVGAFDIDASGDKEKYFKFGNYSPLDSNSLTTMIKEDSFEEVILFVHGFNVKFEEAVVRAAQIKFDLKFPGKVILYSWPAGAEEGFLNQLMIKSTYQFNFTSAKNSREGFRNFVMNLASTGKKIHLIVHSMGHQVVLPAIADIMKVKEGLLFGEMILNAPDFDSREFSAIAPLIKKSAKRVTVYCSPADNALIASSKVNDSKRVGSCEKISGIDMINVNPVDAPAFGIGGLGHGYYSSRPILTDLYQLILGVDVSKRLFIRKSGEFNSEDYVLRK